MSHQVYKVEQNGDTFAPNIKVCGDQFQKCFNAQVSFPTVDGISLIGPSTPGSSIINVTQGVYNNQTDTWFVGDLDAGQCVTSNFSFRVDDITKADDDGRFYINLNLSSSCIESDSSDNVTTIVVSVVGSCDEGDLTIGVNQIHEQGGAGNITIS